MNRKKLLINIFSNWTNLVLLILLAFYVSPILVHRLGNDQYGLWTIIVSITGYFTLLDFGVNNAIVRFISKYAAQKETHKANEIYNTAFAFFGMVSLVVVALSLLLGIFFARWHSLEGFRPAYVYLVFLISGLDVGANLIFGVFAATLNGLQEFFKMNLVSILLTLLKNLALVILVFSGYKLLTLALIQLLFNLFKHAAHYVIIKKTYAFFSLDRALWQHSIFREIVQYSVYSFIIAIAGRVIYLTDSIVIGSVINIGAVTFYAIPASLMDYLGKIVGAMTNALIPVISSQEAVGEHEKNATLYVTMTKYLLLLMLPIIFVLFTVGSDFITLWMGAEYGARSTWVLRILLVGYSLTHCQWIAYGILLGISKHKFLAYMMIAEAAANLGISIWLGKIWGIEGVAFGTTAPLLLANLFIIPCYVCRVLKIQTVSYYLRGFFKPVAMLVCFGALYALFPVRVGSYLQLLAYSAGVAAIWWGVGFFAIVEKEHQHWLRAALAQKIGSAKKRPDRL